MQRLISVSALVLMSATAAMARDDIKGSYGFTGTAACLVAPGHIGDPNGPPLNNPTPGLALANSGFKPNLRPNDAVPGSSTQSYSRSFAVEGIRTFNGDGTGTVKGTAVNITVRPTPGPSGFPAFPTVREFCGFRVLVHIHGQWRRQLDKHHGAGKLSPKTIMTGPRAGQTARSTPSRRLRV